MSDFLFQLSYSSIWFDSCRAITKMIIGIFSVVFNCRERKMHSTWDDSTNATWKSMVQQMNSIRRSADISLSSCRASMECLDRHSRWMSTTSDEHHWHMKNASNRITSIYLSFIGLCIFWLWLPYAIYVPYCVCN